MVSYDKTTIILLATHGVTNIGDNAMKIVFLKISNMKYYKGVCKNDTPSYGGDYVKENGYGHEEYNFYPMQMEDSDAIECIGFEEAKNRLTKASKINKFPISRSKSADISATKIEHKSCKPHHTDIYQALPIGPVYHWIYTYMLIFSTSSR